MQSTRHPFRQHVVPHAPGAIRAFTCEEAVANLRAQLFIVLTAPTARSCQPGIEPAPRDTERPHNHPAGQITRCFAMKENFTSIPSRSRPRLFLGCLVRPSAWSPPVSYTHLR